MSKHMAGSADVAEQSHASDAVHATALVLGETGVLIRGPSGSGKSGLALALLALGRARRLFASLIGDDRVWIRMENRQILARGAPAILGLIERRGFGIVETPTEPCAIVRLVVDLLPQGERVSRLPDDGFLKAFLCGVELPRLIFDRESGPTERAYAVLGRLDKLDDKIITGFAHFA
jgi:HPr kinase/phosphorylase